MAATDQSPLTKGYQPVTWNFKLLAQRHARRLRRHGRGHVGADRARRPAHHLAGARERAEEFHRRRRLRSAQAESGVPDRSAARQYALELAGDLRQHDGGGLSDLEEGSAAGRLRAVRHFQAGKSEVDRVLRLLRVRIRAACISSGSATANTCIARRARAISRRRIRRTTSSTAASTCAIRRSRSKSAAGGCPARGRATTSCRRRGIRSTRAFAPTTPTSIRNGRTAATSPISTAACSCSTFPTRPIRRRSRSGPIRRPIPASCTPSCRCSTAA